MSGVDGGRCPAAPAQDALRRFAHAHAVPLKDLGAVLGIDQRVVTSTMGRRWLPWDLADAVAIAVRRHPCDLWPDWFPRPRATAAAGPARRHS